MAELNEDEVDNLLYFARHNEIHDLKECAMELSKKYGASPSIIFQSTLDPHSGNTALHLASANGHLGNGTCFKLCLKILTLTSH
jgi:uncharacterized protein